MKTPTTPGDLTKATLIQASELGARLWRVNVGLAWIGEIIDNDTANKTMTLQNPRPFRAGVVGMSDTGGFTPVLITPDMVGQTLPVYTVIENKLGQGRLTPEQRAFLEMVHRNGGRAGVARSVHDVEPILQGRAGPPFR